MVDIILKNNVNTTFSNKWKRKKRREWNASSPFPLFCFLASHEVNNLVHHMLLTIAI
jgi:hypothetical protein